MKKCYICNSGNDLSPHHLTPQKNGGSNDQRNKIQLCEKCHNEFETADWSKINRAREAYKEQKKDNLQSIKSFTSPRGNLVEWDKKHKEFREWEKFSGGLKSYPYTGKVP